MTEQEKRHYKILQKEYRIKYEIKKNILMSRDNISFNDILDLKIDLELFGKGDKNV